MILETNEYTKFEDFVFSLKTESALWLNAYSALLTYHGNETGIDMEQYVVIRVGSFYAVTQILDERRPIIVSELVQPFDETNVYKEQQVRKTITWA